MMNKIKSYYKFSNLYLTTNEYLRVAFNFALVISIVLEIWTLVTAYWLWDADRYSFWFAYGVPDIVYSLFTGYCLSTRYGMPAAIIFTMSLARIWIVGSENLTLQFTLMDSIICLIMLLMILLAVLDQMKTLNGIELSKARRA